MKRIKFNSPISASDRLTFQVAENTEDPEMLGWTDIVDLQWEESRRKLIDKFVADFLDRDWGTTEPSGIGIRASDSKGGIPHPVPYGTSASWNVGDNNEKPTIPNWWTPHCDHEFVDTGTLKSYCKKCDADAVWCSKELKFVLK